MDNGNGGDHRPGRVLVVGGTHGNERNGLWLLEQWRQHPGLLHRHGLALELMVGNPVAAQANRRYVDRDLNRSFRAELLSDPHNQELEVLRARQLLARHGPEGKEPCLVAIDLHSTTAAMGNSLVLYNRRPASLALAAVLQRRLGLHIYLQECDSCQSGYLGARGPGSGERAHLPAEPDRRGNRPGGPGPGPGRPHRPGQRIACPWPPAQH